MTPSSRVFVKAFTVIVQCIIGIGLALLITAARIHMRTNAALQLHFARLLRSTYCLCACKGALGESL